jgi:hypothetical protein
MRLDWSYLHLDQVWGTVESEVESVRDLSLKHMQMADVSGCRLDCRRYRMQNFQWVAMLQNCKRYERL